MKYGGGFRTTPHAFVVCSHHREIHLDDLHDVPKYLHVPFASRPMLVTGILHQWSYQEELFALRGKSWRGLHMQAPARKHGGVAETSTCSKARWQ